MIKMNKIPKLQKQWILKNKKLFIKGGIILLLIFLFIASILGTYFGTRATYNNTNQILIQKQKTLINSIYNNSGQYFGSVESLQHAQNNFNISFAVGSSEVDYLHTIGENNYFTLHLSIFNQSSPDSIINNNFYINNYSLLITFLNGNNFNHVFSDAHSSGFDTDLIQYLNATSSAAGLTNLEEIILNFYNNNQTQYDQIRPRADNPIDNSNTGGEILYNYSSLFYFVKVSIFYFDTNDNNIGFIIYGLQNINTKRLYIPNLFIK